MKETKINIRILFFFPTLPSKFSDRQFPSVINGRQRLQVGSLTYLGSLHEQNFQDQAIKTAARNGRITAESERSV